MNTIKILIVDDEPQLCELLKQTLMEYSPEYDVETACDGTSAMRKLAENHFDVMVIDIRMPGVDGLQVTENAKNLLPDLQTIVVTGHGDLDTAVKALRLGALNYFQKPVPFEVLHYSIQKGIEKTKLIRELKKSEKKYRSLTENINVGIFRFTSGKNSRFIEVNPALTDILGYDSRDDLLASDVSDIYVNQEDQYSILEKINRNGYARSEEIRLKRKDGSVFTASLSAVAIADDEGSELYYDGILEDISS